MNKHYGDSLYYLKRAGEHAKLGLVTTLEPAVTKVRKLAGREVEPEPDRVDAVVENVRAFEERAEMKAREGFDGARKRISGYRP